MAKRQMTLPTISMTVRAKGYEDGPITVEEAQEWLTKNTINRPVRRANVKRLALEILRGTYELNGEPVIRSPEGDIGNGQHQLFALIEAEKIRQKNPDHWRQYGWKGPVTMDKIVIDGIPRDRFDTLDIAQKRTGGDVLYRQKLFAEGEYKPSERKILSNDLSVAVRLVWLRAGGMVVSDAPKFPHSEMLRFLDQHKAIVDAVKFVWTTDRENGKAISQRISRGYMAAMMYLFAAKDGPEQFEKLFNKAEELVLSFAMGTDMGKGDPLYELRELLISMKGNSGERNARVSAIVKAFTLAHNGEKVAKRTDLRVKAREPEPRFGGLDSEVEAVDEVAENIPDDAEEQTTEPEEAPKPARPKRPRRKAA